MSGAPLGLLPPTEPLYAFLAGEVMERVAGSRIAAPVFEGSPLDADGVVYRFRELGTGIDLVGKFYSRKWIDGSRNGGRELRAALARREYENLTALRAQGLDAHPHRVVRPLGVGVQAGCVLVEEYATGTDLDHHVREAIRTGRDDVLAARLDATAGFLAFLHGRTATGRGADPEAALVHLDLAAELLGNWEIISRAQCESLAALRGRWSASGILEGTAEVLVHGDANPAHFRFDEDRGVTAIDLESLQAGDRALDLGCLAAELKHMFWHLLHDPWASEPYISRLYTSYAGHLPGGAEDFAALTERGRFAMGCYLLRIGRNPWLDLEYRRNLIREAEACLRI